MAMSDGFFSHRTNEPYGSLCPLVVSRLAIGPIELSVVTHEADAVLGAMLRGERSMCPHVLGELDFMLGVLKPGAVVLDVGANLGLVTLVLAKAEPGLRLRSGI